MASDREAVQPTDVEQDPHPSGVSYVKISLWTEGECPGDGLPHESFGGPIHDGGHYALGDGELGSAKELYLQFIESHLEGECDCLQEVGDGE